MVDPLPRRNSPERRHPIVITLEQFDNTSSANSPYNDSNSPSHASAPDLMTINNAPRLSASSFEDSARPSSMGLDRNLPDFSSYTSHVSDSAGLTQMSTPLPEPVKLRGVDTGQGATTLSALASSNAMFENTPVLIDESSMLQLGLEDALGKSGNWLTKGPQNENHRPSIDAEGNHTYTEPASSSADETRSAEEGLLHHHHLSKDMFLPTRQNLSRAVKAFSARIVAGQEPEEVPSRDRSRSPAKHLDSERPSHHTRPSPRNERRHSVDYFSTPNLHDSNKDKDLILEVSTTLDETHTMSLKDRKDSMTDMESPISPTTLPVKLVGRSLKIFGPDNKFRLFVYNLLQSVWVEPLMMFLVVFQTVVLTVGSVRSIFPNAAEYDSPPTYKDLKWTISYVNWFCLTIFMCYTIIAIAKIIAYGFIDDSQRKNLTELQSRVETVSTTDASTFNEFHPRKRRVNTKNTPLVSSLANLIPKNKRTYTPETIEYSMSFQIAPQRAYLRSSWNRLDFIAIFCYWVSLLLTINDVDSRSEAFIFRLLSALPILHLLNLTRGTSAILKSLKIAAPLLVNVGLFVGFFW